jgi:DNA-binding CsgD family transcriptional regulator
MSEADQPLLRWPRPEGGFIQHFLDSRSGPIVIGRSPQATICIADDATVSRAHARVFAVDGFWLIEDIGSVAGTLIARDGPPRRLNGAERLNHNDRVHIGTTVLRYQQAALDDEVRTARAQHDAIEEPTARELQILTALCAHACVGRGGSPSNKELAASFFIDEETVKTHIAHLFRKFNVHDVPSVRKRDELVHRAIRFGYVDCP